MTRLENGAFILREDEMREIRGREYKLIIR